MFFRVFVSRNDADGDGSYDVWLGSGADEVHIWLNTHRNLQGVGADVPRNLKAIEATAKGVTLQWEAPQFAANVRYYKVFRSLAPNVDEGDRQLIEIVGQRHQDESFAAPVKDRVGRFTDRTALPGMPYHYAIQHIGSENSHSDHCAELTAKIPSSEARRDDGSPELTIINPTHQSWSQFPRIVLHYADGGSGIELSSLSVSFDQPLSDETPANQNVAGRAFRRDANCCILPIRPPQALPVGELVTLTASVADRAGHTTTRSLRFYVSEKSAKRPKAAFSAKILPGDGTFHNC
jgi:hypothetical protein